ncbi:MAG: DUF58 domain-containing protein [Granulosicoccus sp.]
MKKPSDQRQIQFSSPASTSLEELLKLRVAAVALQRQVTRKSAAPQSGGSVSRRLGRGLDFAEVREYQAGDDVRMIDWKVTARTGKAHTKLFVEERERPVLLLVDFRANMRFGTRGMYKSMLAARLAALLGWCAVSAHDRVGGFVFSDDWHSEIRPQSGRRGLMALFRAIHHAQQSVPYTHGEQFIKTLRRLRHSVHSGSTVVLLSDFHGFDENARKTLGSALNAMDMVAVHLCDPLDYRLPMPGNYPMRSNSSEKAKRWVLSVGSRSDRERYAQDFNDRQQSLKNLFVQQRHTYHCVSTAEDILDVATRILTPQGHHLVEPEPV